MCEFLTNVSEEVKVVLKMKTRINHIKRGAWYVYKRGDLYAIHQIFSEFYKKAIVPLCGEMKKFVFEYNYELKTVSIRHFFSERKIHLVSNQEFANQVYLLLDTIAATGIVGAPFYSVEIKFDPRVGSLTDMRKDNILTYKGGKGDKSGYYYLRGVLA